mgnify:CR=1 FL=1
MEELLGLGNGEKWLELTTFLLMGNTSAALRLVNQAAWDGTDMRQLHLHTLDLLRAAMLTQWGSIDMVDLPEHVTSQLQKLCGQMPSWRIIKALKLWGEVNMRYDAPSTLPLELAVVEICNDQGTSPLAGTAQTVSTRVPTQTAISPTPQPPPSLQTQSTSPKELSDTTNPGSTASSNRSADNLDTTVASSPTISAPAPTVTSEATNGAPPDMESAGLETQWLAAVKELGRKKGNKYNLGALLQSLIHI